MTITVFISQCNKEIQQRLRRGCSEPDASPLCESTIITFCRSQSSRSLQCADTTVQFKIIHLHFTIENTMGHLLNYWGRTGKTVFSFLQLGIDNVDLLLCVKKHKKISMVWRHRDLNKTRLKASENFVSSGVFLYNVKYSLLNK